jgi:two-component system response regulator YesN
MEKPSKKLKLVIADDEELICAMLEKIIALDELALEITAFAHDGKTLLSIIESERPDIVITDIKMPFLSGLDVIRVARQEGWQSRFIVISGYKHFEYAQSALRYNVSDYLLKPISPEEMNGILRKISGEIRLKGSGYGASSVFRRGFFIKKLLSDGEIGRMPLDKMNELCGTAFRQGAFRFLFAKIDYIDDNINDAYPNFSSILEKVEDYARECFKSGIYDMLCNQDTDGVGLLINYNHSDEEHIVPAAEKFLTVTKNVTDMFSGFFITVGASAVFDSLEKAAEAWEKAEAAVWSRMSRGLGRVIYYRQDEFEISPEWASKIDGIEQRIRRCFESFDADSFYKTMKEFYTLPGTVLSSVNCMRSLRRLQRDFFATNDEIIQGYANVDSLHKETIYHLKFAYRFNRYFDIFRTGFTGIMRDINEYIKNRNARPVRQAIAYIEERFGSSITLEILAKEVGLSPVYFSAVFKKETGTNFSNYLAGFRIKKAKEMLKKSNANISEIAYGTGFQDPKYFSKFFKKTTGVSAAVYRRIYG